MLLLFIGESLGMQELILIGVIALIIFGPRKLPQIARTIGKTMAEFRKATSDFRSTWEREVDLEGIENEDPARPVPRTAQTETVDLPSIRPVDPPQIEESTKQESPAEVLDPLEKEEIGIPRNDKRDWL